MEPSLHYKVVILMRALFALRWVSFLALTITPALTIYGVFNVKWNTYTAIWSVLYYFVTGLGITAGYHVSTSV